ncbi:copper-binding protein [Roseateles violae]|uniref:Copper-binding protein n=1 Tax=Roseateles violae TaxID=3058042 RepID=A0ABT8DTX7_9BURK|nr:copper-binding protein [Pelomonas sp. PFR6]MDN3920359.1 copper-binding protein [Pelomonas sp. PFR6]
MMTRTCIAGLLALTLLGTAAAQSPRASAASQSATRPMAEGEVRKIDRAQGKLTLRHGRIENLDMDGMTMVFRLAEPKLLDGLKEGDRVRFAAERIAGAVTVTAIEAAP